MDAGPDKGCSVNDLVARYGAELLGERNAFGSDGTFPLLVKFIDAQDDLSIQVHPDDELAAELGQPNGKTEMWYIIKADKDAKIVSGFSRPVSRAELPELAKGSNIESVINRVDAKEGDLFFIPAGRLHSLCKGNLVLEVQQPSDLTFRVYDYERRDHRGNLRPLQVENAVRAINPDDADTGPVQYKLQDNIPINVINCPFFSVNLLQANNRIIRNYQEWDTFVVLVCLKGKAKVSDSNQTLSIAEGRTVLIPAACNGVTITPDRQSLFAEIFIR